VLEERCGGGGGGGRQCDVSTIGVRILSSRTRVMILGRTRSSMLLDVVVVVSRAGIMMVVAFLW
jgi:hypothetical protein